MSTNGDGNLVGGLVDRLAARVGVQAPLPFSARAMASEGLRWANDPDLNSFPTAPG